MSNKDTRYYIGLKMIEAWPQVKPSDGVGQRGQDGYGVRYPDGYESWSPKATFEDAYREVDDTPFPAALEACIRGAKIYRRGWNGVRSGLEMYVFAQYPDNRSLMTEPYLVMVTLRKWETEEDEGHDIVRIPWLISQGDAFAQDWVIEWPPRD